MKNKIKILLVFLLIAVCYATVHAVDITVATDVQLLNQFLMPNETAAQKTKALEGARFNLGLADTASVATVTAAIKAEFRKWLRNGYLAKKQQVTQLYYRTKADSTTSADLW